MVKLLWSWENDYGNSWMRNYYANMSTDHPGEVGVHGNDA